MSEDAGKRQVRAAFRDRHQQGEFALTPRKRPGPALPRDSLQRGVGGRNARACRHWPRVVLGVLAQQTRDHSLVRGVTPCSLHLQEHDLLRLKAGVLLTGPSQELTRASLALAGVRGIPLVSGDRKVGILPECFTTRQRNVAVMETCTAPDAAELVENVPFSQHRVRRSWSGSRRLCILRHAGGGDHPGPRHSKPSGAPEIPKGLSKAMGWPQGYHPAWAACACCRGGSAEQFASLDHSAVSGASGSTSRGCDEMICIPSGRERHHTT